MELEHVIRFRPEPAGEHAEPKEVLTGAPELTDARGRTARFTTGDAFVIAAGFKGTWETVDPVKKLYAVYEKPKG